MAKLDEEYNVELCTTPPAHNELELSLMDNDNLDSSNSSIYSWKLVKRRRPRRRYTVSHGGGGGGGGGGVSGGGGGGSNGVAGITLNGHHSTPLAMCTSSNGSGGLPPAPPSTPTSLTPTNTSLSSSLPNAGIAEEEQQRLDSLLYILDYAPKYKKKLKEQQRTDAELAELFNVVSITASNGSSSSSSSKTKLQPERGVSSLSRSIRKHDLKTFKIYNHLKDSFRERDEEDSVSAPEYDTEEEDTRFHRLGRIKPSQRLSISKRRRRIARFEHNERMEAMVDIFDEAMNFNET